MGISEIVGGLGLALFLFGLVATFATACAGYTLVMVLALIVEFGSFFINC